MPGKRRGPVLDRWRAYRGRLPAALGGDASRRGAAEVVFYQGAAACLDVMLGTEELDWVLEYGWPEWLLVLVRDLEWLDAPGVAPPPGGGAGADRDAAGGRDG